jgi:hypothetical protein
MAWEIHVLIEAISERAQLPLKIVINLENTSSITLDAAEELCQVYRFGKIYFCEASPRILAFMGLTDYLWVFDIYSVESLAIEKMS